jgi:hypothetical protein
MKQAACIILQAAFCWFRQRLQCLVDGGALFGTIWAEAVWNMTEDDAVWR